MRCATGGFVCAFLGSGCASVELRDDGSTLFLGCSRIETKPVFYADKGSGEMLDVHVAGLLVLTTPLSKGFAIGVSRERAVVIGQDTVLTLESALPLQSLTRGAIR